ncbi:MAG: hypothetical protein QOF89_2428 [Acidobacteriota bacterium]|jgi:hypothetical protein|nr:hypothetical protein [Acidobacteriota bacterium]
MPIRRVLTPFVLSILLLSSPLLAQPHRPNPPAPAASAASLLPHLRDLAAAFWARVVGIPEKSGSSLNPDGLTGSSTPNASTDIGSNLDPNGKT